MKPSTFSIVAVDLEAGELGVAVQSKFLAVGAAVPWLEGGIGAIATQAWANTSYGPRGLALLRAGASPDEAVKALVAEDDGRTRRQLGIVDARGKSATYTGEECTEWAGGLCGDRFAAQGNILAGSTEPIEQLAHLLDLHMLYFAKPKPADIMKIDDAIGAELVGFLVELGALGKGHQQFDKDAFAAFERVMGVENLEERLRTHGTIDGQTLGYFREKLARGTRA